MTYALTAESNLTLGHALRGDATAATLYLEHPAQLVRVELDFEHEADKLAVRINMEHCRDTMRLQAGDPANAQHLREQIEAIANGTADTAATGAIGASQAKASEPFALGDQDESSIRTVVRHGGTRHLYCNATVTVHTSALSQRLDALVSTRAGTEHLHAGTPGELYVVLAQHIEAALNAA
ncbi:MAG: hypothetical protein KJ884_02025 [Gammaproteobacteria bacterium]|uniref:Uncharacterized protein n=1 Tax=viral metagenome TaxID=1070528 RepID=A0A6M3J835_9ZZZZ|nr:hypothetical protein [Gammaproteobacteria bacterium]MBU1492246.1 hypothetical protein [Gammaproteobacteria bacterium]MBU2066817.1 hypothetical protein [Gammaproteobacteria bacterium]MBU2137367.1 hypothetical protein [Gammaproteobacteria bacterium]MBU2215072.1 hypothetical protein [Gammaproteobacteria bacterium]